MTITARKLSVEALTDHLKALGSGKLSAQPVDRSQPDDIFAGQPLAKVMVGSLGVAMWAAIATVGIGIAGGSVAIPLGVMLAALATQVGATVAMAVVETRKAYKDEAATSAAQNAAKAVTANSKTVGGALLLDMDGVAREMRPSTREARPARAPRQGLTA